jgi:hypothetical protein
MVIEGFSGGEGRDAGTRQAEASVVSGLATDTCLPEN